MRGVTPVTYAEMPGDTRAIVSRVCKADLNLLETVAHLLNRTYPKVLRLENLCEAAFFEHILNLDVVCLQVSKHIKNSCGLKI
jgi:hypothetical protein